MKIVMMDPKKLKPYQNNPRINDQAIQAVMNSINTFGWRQPIVVDPSLEIIIGHTRQQVAFKRKDKLVPVHIAEDLTPEQTRALRLVENKTHELAEWDVEALLAEASELVHGEEGIDLLQFGFSKADLKMIEEGEQAVKEDVRWLEDFTAPPQAKPQWVLMQVPAEDGPVIVNKLRKTYKNVVVHYSGESAKA